MLPDGVLSSTNIPSPLIWRPIRTSPYQDSDTGGVHLVDVSQGNIVKLWTVNANPDTGDIYISAEGEVPVLVLNVPGVSWVSLTFDSNMRYCISYMQGTVSKLYWYNNLTPAYETITLPPGSYYPCVTLDDKRQLEAGISSIILGYIRAGQLIYRDQKDRFTIEYMLNTGATAVFLLDIGMSQNLRLQFVYGY